MRWAINKDGVNTGTVFDDGILWASPGDPEFTKDKINEEIAKLGEGYSADWIGVTDPVR